MPTLAPDYKINALILLVFLLASSLIFVRTSFFDILDMQGDQILGRETLPLLIGEKRTLRLLKSLLLAVIAGLVLLTILSPSLFWGAVILCPISLYGILSAYERQKMMSQIYLEFLVETHFLYVGLVALATF